MFGFYLDINSESFGFRTVAVVSFNVKRKCTFTSFRLFVFKDIFTNQKKLAFRQIHCSVFVDDACITSKALLCVRGDIFRDFLFCSLSCL